MDKGMKKPDVFTINTPKMTLPGVSLKFATKDPCYTLGGCVTVTSSSSISEHMHIDSICYRLLRHMKLNSSLISTSDASQVSDVIFGTIRPAVTRDAVTDLVELPLPCASLNDCVWTTSGSFFSCRYEVEVSIAISLDASITATVGDVEYSPITFTLPVKVVPPQTCKAPCLPAWTSLCLVALAEGETGVSPHLSKEPYQEWCDLPGASCAPCQIVQIHGGQRGAGGLTPSAAQGMLSPTNNENSEYRSQLRRSTKAGGLNKKRGLNVIDANAIMPGVHAGEPSGNDIDCCEIETYLPPSENDYSDALVLGGYVEDLFDDVSALSCVWRPGGTSMAQSDDGSSCEDLLFDELPPLLLKIN
ncbi:hypothetical protein TSMEX_003942 [Taenia solium]|eukprot:TsM_000360000 transcript=TsM_000360000 gene=TsM_000360000